MNQVFLNKAV